MTEQMNQQRMCLMMNRAVPSQLDGDLAARTGDHPDCLSGEMWAEPWNTGTDQDARRSMPRQWKGHTFYSREELAAMTPDEYHSALRQHRANPVREDELPRALIEDMNAKLTERVEEFEARRQSAS